MNNESIASRVVSEANYFEIVTGGKPDRVYMGHTEWIELKEWVRFHVELLGDIRQLQEIQRPQIYGLDIFRVDEPNHLLVSASYHPATPDKH